MREDYKSQILKIISNRNYRPAKLTSLARNIGRGTVSMKGGKWEKKALKGVEIDGKTLGLIGIGRIGCSLARKASALGMRILTFDAYIDECPLPDLAEICTREREGDGHDALDPRPTLDGRHALDVRHPGGS